MPDGKMDRRKFLYLGAGAVVALAAAGVGYLYRSKQHYAKTVTQTIVSTTTPTSPVITIKPPKIISLEYKPTKVINDKVYDINVTLAVENSSRMLKEAEVSLFPVEYPHLPKEAFPKEEIKTIKLQPKGLEREMFDITFADLKGGREYLIKAVAKDVAGSTNSEERKTPYLRELENITKKSGFSIIAHYTVWDRGHWRIPISVTPILGQYSSTDPIVISRHVDWANGYGIKGFTVDWYGSSDITDLNTKTLFNHPLTSSLPIAIMFDSSQLPKSGEFPNIYWDIDNPIIRSKIVHETLYLSETYFVRENYWRINGRPVIYYWASGAWVGDLHSLFTEIRRSVTEKVGLKPFIIGDPVFFNEPNKSRIEPFDAITQWANYNHTGNPSNLEEQIDYYYGRWQDIAKTLEVRFVPSALAGFYRPANPEMAYLERSPNRLRKQLTIGLKYVDPQLKTIFITTFNDPHETGIEPSKEYGFADLEVIREFFLSNSSLNSIS
jgi:hypothetical protein